MVFYRKYRPQTIEELDSKDVRDALYALLGKDISHAFLFTGPKGLGKTSAARIAAKVINCERLVSQRLAASIKEKKLNAKRYTLNPDIEPCNKCYQCISITTGTNIDVLEIDAASNRGIDEIRDLREKVRLAPAASFKKIYIIDEVHMLTQEAFNALLKTLEEPPSHVIFVLCTTEPHKVPLTILSRCFHIPFRKATSEELVRSFKRIVDRERIDIDNETLYLIASLSDGSFRDGVKILEEMVLVAKDKKITKELVEKKYQVSSIKYQISQMIKFLAKRDTKGGLKLVSELVEEGVDMKYFIEQLIAALHAILLAELGVGQERKVEDRPWKIEDIGELVELLVKAYGELKYAVLPQLPLEMVIVEWCMQKSVLRSLRQFKNSSNASPVPYGNRASVPASRYRSPRDTPSQAGPSEEFSHAKAPRTLKGNEIWQVLINKVKLHNHSIAGVLRGCTLKGYDGRKLVIETNYKFHKERLDESRAREIIERACSEVAGKPVSVSILLKEK